MATVIGRSLDEINKKAKELNNSIQSLSKQNKELDKSLKFNSNPLEVLTQRAKNTQTSIQKLTERIELLKEKQKEYQKELEQGKITQNTFDKLCLDIQKADNQLAQFNAELKKTNETIKSLPLKKFDDISNGFAKTGQALKGVSIAAAGVLTGLTALSIKTLSNVAELQDYADRLGVTAEALQRYDYIALQSGVETEQLVKSVAKARDAVGTALAGSSNTATQALEKLFGNLQNIPKDSEAAFSSIIEQLSKVEDKTLQAYYANEIFGEKLATDLIPLINNGAEKLNQLGKEFEDIGYLTNEQVKSLANFDDEMNIIKKSFAQTGNELTVAFLPVMQKIAEVAEEKIVPAFKKFADWVGNLNTKTLAFIVGGLGLLAVLSPILLMMSKIIVSIKNIVGSGGSIKQLLDSIHNHPIITTITIIVGLLAVLYATNEEFRDSINSLFETLKPLFNLMLGFSSEILKSLISLLSTLLNAIAPILTVFIKSLNVQLNGLLLMLVPILYVLEAIIKAMKSAIQFGKDFFSLHWGDIGKNQKDIWSDWSTNDFTQSTWDNLKNSIGDFFGNDTSLSSNILDYPLPSMSSDNSYSSYNSNDNYNVNIEFNASGDLDYDANELAEAVMKRLAVKKQAAGR